jgi:streptomycin 6-kinase
MEEDMNMVGSHMVEVAGMHTVEEHEHPMNHRPEVEGMDWEDNGMGEDMMVEVKVVEREREGVVLARHWTGDGMVTSQRAHRE